jgi:KDO2-lipid IV(A) lauroyltransferase
MFITRNKSLTEHTVIIDNPLIFEFTVDKEQDMKNISAGYTSVIEKYIRRNPEQWMWVHNRWEDG